MSDGGDVQKKGLVDRIFGLESNTAGPNTNRQEWTISDYISEAFLKAYFHVKIVHVLCPDGACLSPPSAPTSAWAPRTAGPPSRPS